MIASAFYARSTEIVIKAGKVLGEDVSYYEDLYKKIVDKFRINYPEYHTQTECVLALKFDLAREKESVAEKLVKMIKNNGNKLSTVFVGTPYIMHALSENGYTDVAYDLLLQEESPSWLFSIKMGATTIWEHWDGIDESGKMWSDDMNSYNHYTYGAVADWIYSVSAGINTDEELVGYKKAVIAPKPDKRLGFLKAEYKTTQGTIKSEWEYTDQGFKHYIETPVDSEIILGDKKYSVKKGKYMFVVPLS